MSGPFDDKWRDSYDAWKLATPPEYEEGPDEPDEEAERIAWLDGLMQEVKTKQDEVAPRAFGWVATLGDYDLGDPIGRGVTEQEAIQDLIKQLEAKR